MNSKLSLIANKVYADQRISREEAVDLYASNDLAILSKLATYVRTKKAKENYKKAVWWNTNLHLNPTNVCIGFCNFCAFAKRPNEEGAYTMTIDEATQKAVRGYELGATEVHIVGGLNPKAALPYYSELLGSIKSKVPGLHIKAFTAVEIAFFAKLTKKTPSEVLAVLREAGLDSMPGGGAEVFAKSVRDDTCPDKIPAEQWLSTHYEAHKQGLKTNATMLAGIGENFEDRIDHMLLLREQQDRSLALDSGCFQTFIPLSCHYEDTDIADQVEPITGIEQIKNIAISRIVLDNFDHIKAYWVQLGHKMAQLALHFGADDIDGTVVDEKITNAAGSGKKATQAEILQNLIRGAGFIPMERDTLYNVLDRKNDRDLVLSFN
ncbi:MAG: CofH family radical SAM protein [Candidatus Caenarcaniphilales bacterium]|nr:CofH family radical SAM protein [Candidatus Caenarcaniphilales bacterium]